MKALSKDIVREVRGTFTRFIAIFAIVALGTGFFAGLKATSPDMRRTADEYLDAVNMHDLRLISTVGFNADDIAAIEATPEVDAVRPAYFVDAIVKSGDTEKVAHFQSFTEQMNTVNISEGRAPRAADECLVDAGMMGKLNIEIGSVIEVSEKNKKLATDMLQTKKFTVVGKAESPLYITFDRGTSNIGSGGVDLFLIAPEAAFDREYSTEVYLTLKGAAEKKTYTDSYNDLSAGGVTALEAVGKTRSAARYDEVKGDGEKELADGKAKLASEKADGEAKLADARKKLDDGRAEYNKGMRKITDSERTLTKSRADLKKGEAQLNEQKAAASLQITAAKEQLAQVDEQLTSSLVLLNSLSENLMQLREFRRDLLEMGDTTSAEMMDSQIAELEAKKAVGKAEYNKGRAAYDAGVSELSAKENMLKGAEQKIADGWRALASGEKQLATGKADLAKAKKTLDNGEREYSENYIKFDNEIKKAETEIADNEKKLADFEMPEWMVLDRQKNAGYVGLSQDIDRIDAISVVFPIFFFLVAALVCLTTMTRMVEEHRTEIGTFKALGYSRYKIAKKYILYALIACISGSALGLCVGFQVFPKVIWNAYGMLYPHMPPIVAPFNIGLALVATGGAIICTVLSALVAVIGELHETPAALMRPKPPKRGKRILLERIGFIWSKMNFTHKITARNLFRYKKRFLMTVIGIAGCTALMLAGFGIKDSIGDIVGKQYGEITRFGMTATIAAGKDAAAMEQIKDERLIEDSLRFHQKLVSVKGGDRNFDVELFVPSVSDMSKFVTLRERRSGKELALTDNGVIISEKLSEVAKLKVGDSINATIEDKSVSFKITGICENYVYHKLYMTPALYKSVIGSEPTFDKLAALVYGGAEQGAESRAAQGLLESGNFTAVDFTDSMMENFTNALGSLDYVVLVLIICAALLSFVVLYNLTNINITERIREIATIKVLGFVDREVSSYVYRENVVLTLIGTAAGLLLGIALHSFVIRSAELDFVMFGRTISWLSYALSALLTIMFSLFVNFVMYFKLKKVSMVESLKSVE